MNRYVFLTALSLFLLGGLFFYQNSKFNDGKLHMVVCDVGQGDGIYIRTPKGEDILIDAGPDDSILTCLTSHMPFWDKEIELAVLTHPDADHLTGFISVIQRYSFKHFVTIEISKNTAIYRKLQNELRDYNITPKYLFAGDKIGFEDGTSLELFWPQKDFFIQNAGKADKGSLGSNDFAIVQTLSYGNFKALLTADAGANIEDMIAQSVGKIDVLKVPHHGSKTGMSDYFLSQINPSLAVISVGNKNRYGHPRQEMLDLLSNRSIKVLRTDRNGDVEIVTDGKTYQTVSN